MGPFAGPPHVHLRFNGASTWSSQPPQSSQVMKISELPQSLLCPSLRTRSAVHWLPSLTVCCPAFFPYGGCSESSTGLLGAYTQDTLGNVPAAASASNRVHGRMFGLPFSSSIFSK